MEKIIKNILFAACAAFVGLMLYMAITDSPRADLEERYASVEEVSWTIRPFRCTATKGRATYNFKATTHNGDKVTGYICFTPGFTLVDSVIHESAE